MKENLKITTFTILILTVLSCKNYREYKPVFFNGDELIESTKPITEAQKKNIIQVLKYYKVPFEFQDNKIMIDPFVDKEMIWNYTSKANDSGWLKTHKNSLK
jgi:hypothetical protein